MEIKFKKLFKTTLLFFVVFVMIFNSFAAISVSDGSAFVTKAEFSADLNNLSNRMSALENSIDAKIDSLVSSYLSRNGIWNGEKQTVTSTKYWDVLAPDISLSDDGHSAMSSILSSATFINTITKSGLLVGFIYYTDGNRSQLNRNTSRWGYRLNYLEPKYFKTDSGFVLYTNLSETIGSTDTVKYSAILGSGFSELYYTLNIGKTDSSSTLALTTASMGISLPSTEITYPVSFFVQKGSAVKISVGVDIHIRSCEAVYKYEHAVRVGVLDNFYVY